jgi:hypothetical protein
LYFIFWSLFNQLVNHFFKYEIFVSHFPDFCRKIFQKIAKCNKCDGQCEPCMYLVYITILGPGKSHSTDGFIYSSPAINTKINSTQKIILQECKSNSFITYQVHKNTEFDLRKKSTDTFSHKIRCALKKVYYCENRIWFWVFSAWLYFWLNHPIC